MKEKYELIGSGDSAHLIRKYKNHWYSRWKIEMDGTIPKNYPVDQKNCKHEYEYVKNVIGAEWYCIGTVFRLYRCCKCGHERITKI